LRRLEIQVLNQPVSNMVCLHRVAGQACCVWCRSVPSDQTRLQMRSYPSDCDSPTKHDTEPGESTDRKIRNRRHRSPINQQIDVSLAVASILIPARLFSGLSQWHQ